MESAVAKNLKDPLPTSLLAAHLLCWHLNLQSGRQSGV
jgi:hypothetical protein